MAVPVNSMKTITKNVPNVTLQHYVLEKNVYNYNFYRDFDVSMSKLIVCNCINILCCTLLKPVLTYELYQVDSLEKR